MGSKRVIVIMAGGAGERFWPLSRQHRPKQLLNLTSPDKSLLAEAVERVCPAIVSPENVYVVTARHLQDPIREANLGIPPENILGEPCKRNTAGCLAFAAACLQARLKCDPDEITMGVITADQQIGNPDPFRQAVTTAFEAAERHEALITLGIRPTRPETGYGYIEVAADMAHGACTAAACPAYPVVRFREKPDRETAGRFLATGRFFWNSGMFFWRISIFRKELHQATPKHAQALDQMVQAMNACDAQQVDRIFANLTDISIDYALLEKARKVLVVPAAFAWDDVGAFDALDRTLPRDPNGNISIGDPVLKNTRDCIVYNQAGSDKMAVAVIGGYDLVVVVTEDAVLVVPKPQVQDVKTVLADLKKRNANQV